MYLKLRVQDVKEFLLLQGYAWNGKIYDRSLSGYREAEEADLNSPFFVTQIVTVESESGRKALCLQFDKTSFNVFNYDNKYINSKELKVDVSNKWREYLYSVYKLEYVGYVRSWCEKGKKSVNDEYNEEIAMHEERLKHLRAKRKKETAFFEKIEHEMDNALEADIENNLF